MIRERTILAGAGAVAVLLVVAGCNPGATEPAAAPATSSSETAPSSAAGVTPASAQAHNDADVTFALHMIVHHTQAIEMSDILVGKSGIDPQVVDLAQQIKAEQTPEIGQMQGWLHGWGVPSMPATSAPSMGHGDHGDMSAMPGMMSDQQMDALRQAQGVDASKTFLTQMIAHHEGAIDMANTEINAGQYPAAIDLARTIVTTQQQEIDTMKGILGRL